MRAAICWRWRSSCWKRRTISSAWPLRIQCEATATIEDNSRYRSERGYRVLRSVSVPRARATEEMYREFARRIELDLPGDDPRAIRVSARAVVELARLVDEARAARADVDPR